MTKQEILLLDARFETVEKTVSDSLDSVQFNIELVDRIENYEIKIYDYLCGLQRFGEIDDFAEDCETVKIGLPDPRNYETDNDEWKAGEVTEDAIDVINDTLAENGERILKWFLRQRFKKAKKESKDLIQSESVAA